MTTFSRRTLLSAAAAMAAASACSTDSDNDAATGASTTTDGPAEAGPIPGISADTPPPIPAYEPHAAFPEGVISGSPLPDAIVLWTRIAPTEVGATADATIPVTVQLAVDPAFDDVLTSDEAQAAADRDHCVSFDVSGLSPSSWYFYRFVVGEPAKGGTISPVGRTRTSPGPDEDVAASRIAYFSCQRYTHGWYTSHGHLAAQRDVDLVISLGDYVYNESKADDIEVAGRLDPTEPATDLATFRKKYELYRSDVNLQAMHAAAPFVCVPDNHDGRESPRTDATFQEGAIATYFERMPVRRSSDEPGRIYSETKWGTLFHLWLLDVRQYRDASENSTVNTATDAAVWDAGLTMLGDAQKAWLKDGLASTDATWKLVGTQQMFSPTRIADLDDVATRASDPGRTSNAGVYINASQWDGYQAERREIVAHLHDRGIQNTIVLSGDMHWFAAGDGQIDVDDPASPYVYSEFTGGSVTSAAGERFASKAGEPVTPGILPVVRSANEQLIRFFDVDRHGYGALDMTPERTQVDFVSPTSITTPDAEVEVLASFVLTAGGTGMEVTHGAQW